MSLELQKEVKENNWPYSDLIDNIFKRLMKPNEISRFKKPEDLLELCKLIDTVSILPMLLTYSSYLRANFFVEEVDRAKRIAKNDLLVKKYHKIKDKAKKWDDFNFWERQLFEVLESLLNSGKINKKNESHFQELISDIDYLYSFIFEELNTWLLIEARNYS